MLQAQLNASQGLGASEELAIEPVQHSHPVSASSQRCTIIFPSEVSEAWDRGNDATRWEPQHSEMLTGPCTGLCEP